MSNIIAIIGRPNVGKSTLFNRLTESRQAIVDETPGVTRDRHYGKVEWNGHQFSIIDTGGLVSGSDDIFENEIRKHVNIAIEEASALIFMVDVVTGITDLDMMVANMVRKAGKVVYLVANKVDNNERINDANVFYRLGLGEVYSLSSINGSGTGELLDDIVAKFEPPVEEDDKDLPRLAIIGQPNVGKSSLLNMLMGEERSIVTPIAGTTRDSVHSHYNAFGNEFMLVDTAGLRKKANVKEDIEFYSVMRSIRAIEESNVCLLLLDATQGLTSQDLSIFHLIEKNKKGVVILINKWDLVEKATDTVKEYENAIRVRLAPFNDVPIVFTSVLTKQRIFKALEMAVKVYNNRKKKITTSQLNKVMLPIIETTPPPAIKGKYIRIKYITQLPIRTPAFAFFCNHPQYVREAYKRFLENQLRKQFDFTGVPISILLKSKD